MSTWERVERGLVRWGAASTVQARGWEPRLVGRLALRLGYVMLRLRLRV